MSILKVVVPLIALSFLLVAVLESADPPPDRRPPAESTVHILQRDEDGSVIALRLRRPDDAGLARVVRENPKLRRIELMSSFHLTPGGLNDLRSLQSLREVQFLHKNAQVTDEAVAVLAQIPRLQVLQIGGGQITDRGLEHLKNIPELRHLAVGGPGITDRGMEILAANNPGIATLDLSGASISDEGLKAIGQVTGLRVLSLYGTRTTDAGLKNLKALKELQSFEPSDSFTDDGLAHLAHCDKLQSLKLMYRGGITDRGIELISNFAALTYLELGGTKISDIGLASLGRLKNLDYLGLSSTRITGAGFERWPDSASLSRLTLDRTQLSPAVISSLQRLSQLRVLRIPQTPIEKEENWKNLGALKQLDQLVINLRKPFRDELQKSLPNCEILVDDLEVDY